MRLFMKLFHIGGCLSGYLIILYYAYGFYNSYRGKVLSVALIAFAVFYCIFRLISAKSDTEPHNMIDIKSFINESAAIEPGRQILLEEKEVNYDLLERSGLMDQIFRTIVDYNSQKPYVMAVTGEWGSGKSTIMKNLRDKLISHGSNGRIEVVEEMDFWSYGSLESVLSALVDAILKKGGVVINPLRVRKIKSALYDLTGDTPVVGKATQVIEKGFYNEYEDMKSIKSELYECLRVCDKTIVVFIDNIDRADVENILYLFRLIETVLALPNVIYLLAYDKDRLCQLLEDSKHIDRKYIDKIVQKEIPLPKMPSATFRNIAKRCLDRVLNHYGVKEDSIEEYAPVYNLVYQKIQDLREFKHYINTVCMTALSMESELHRPHLMLIETIRFFDDHLYNFLKNNRYYLSSLDRDVEGLTSLRGEERKLFNEKAKQYYDVTFESREAYLSVLRGGISIFISL